MSAGRKEPDSASPAEPAPRARLAGTWRRYLRFWGPRPEADVDDELRFHFEMRVRDHMGRGMTEADARAAVLQRLGDVDAVRAQCVAIAERRERGAARALLLDAFTQDLRFTLRGFARQKGWTAVAVLTLALGIGANTAVFSVVNRLLLNPLPYPDADRLALVNLQPTEKNTSGVNVSISPSGPVARAWLGGLRSIEALEAYGQSEVILEASSSPPSGARVAYVQPTFPRFAGQQVLRGRMFSTGDAQRGAPVALLGEHAWRAQFGGSPDVIGRTVRVNDRAVTIIGVLPGRLALPHLDDGPPDLWMPLDPALDNLGAYMIGRLRPGVTHAMALAELDSLAARAQAGTQGAGRFRANITSPKNVVGYEKPLLLLTGTVAIVLLIACVNVAHLLLARSSSRRRELAVRVALGAGRGRLARQLLAETLVLSAAGCAGGLLIGWLGLRTLVAKRPESLAELGAAHMDMTVLLAAIGAALVTGVLFGVMATVHATRQATHEALKAGAPSVSHGKAQHRVRSLLVVTEMALSALLLVGASMLVRSVMNLYTSDPGFEPRGLYSLRPVLPEWRYRNAAARNALYATLVERLRTHPDVASLAIARGVPPGFSFIIGALHLEGEPRPEAGITSLLRYNSVSPSFFSTMRLPVVQGRAFADSMQARGEILVNDGFARKHWPGRSPIGRRINIIGWGGKDTWYTVVGVVKDAALGGLIHDRTAPMFYTLAEDMDRPSIMLRAKGTADLLPVMRSVLAGIDPDLPPPRLSDIEATMRDSASEPRFTMMLLVSFTALALALAAVGLYGVMAYAVARRTREIGIRIALGATRPAIARDVIGGGLLLAMLGATVGLGAAWWGSRLLESLLYGVTRTDAASFVIGALVLLVTAALACTVPMRRAAAVDPVIAMRAD